MNSSFSQDLFRAAPIVGILRHFTPEQVAGILNCYVQSGLTNVEITLNTEGALDMIAKAVEKYGEQLNVGAGTVKTLEDLNAALSVGAQFIVTPIMNAEVIQGCVEKGIPIFPGAYTATEIYAAWNLGATAVKVFPASHGGHAYIKALKGPLDEVKLVPTGGVDLDNIQDFFRAGSEAVGMGGKLFVKKMIQDKDWSALTEHFQKFLTLWREMED